MRKIAMFQPKIVVATGQFETATRQDMPITWSSPMPPGWQRQETQIRVPAGTYLYVPKLAVEPINAWTWTYGGETVAELGAARIVRFTAPGSFVLRILPATAPMAGGFIIVPL